MAIFKKIEKLSLAPLKSHGQSERANPNGADICHLFWNVLMGVAFQIRLPSPLLTFLSILTKYYYVYLDFFGKKLLSTSFFIIIYWLFSIIFILFIDFYILFYRLSVTNKISLYGSMNPPRETTIAMEKPSDTQRSLQGNVNEIVKFL